MHIIGVGTAHPAQGIAQSAAADMAETLCCQTPQHARLLPVLYRQTGVTRRYSVLLQDQEQGSRHAHAQQHPVDISAGTKVPHDVSGGRTSAAIAGPPACAQSFFPPALDGEDRGPSTAERMHVYEQEASALAEEAARNALAACELPAKTITHLVTVSCTGFVSPGVDFSLIRRLGLSTNVLRTNVGFMGCHGAVNAMRVARAFTAEDPRAMVLLCAVELCSLHLQYGWNTEQIVSNALFADGAAAMLGVSSKDTPVNDDSAMPWTVAATGTAVIPNSDDLMSWRIGDHGFEMTLSARVPELIRTHLPTWLDGWLADAGLSRADVGSWIIHPGGPRILEACGDALQLDDVELADSREILAGYGNMSSPTVLFILERLMCRDAERPCVVLAFGPGLAVEAALLR